MASRGRIEIEGLAEARAALARFSRQVDGAAVDTTRDQARDVHRRAQRNRSRAPAAPSGTGWVDYRRERRGAAVALTGPRARATEYGAERHVTFGRPMLARRMRRRPFSRWRSKGGYVVGDVLRRRLPELTSAAADDVLQVLRGALNRAGVPRSGKV